MNPLLKKRNSSTDDKYLLRKYCFLSALCSFGIMVLFYIFHGNTLVFGDRTVLRMDLYHQYGPLYAEVFDRITNGESLVYSWTSGLGGNFLGNFFNYCCSPFAVFMLICGHKNMPEAIALMIMFKAVLASAAFTYYINKTNKTVRQESVFFGLLYAFCGYFVAFSWNIMWLDAMAVLPFVILGIERIIQYNKPVLYIASLTYTMITNYYMAYMVCIVSVLYFLYYYFGRYELASTVYEAAAGEKPHENLPEAFCADPTDGEECSEPPEMLRRTDEAESFDDITDGAPAAADEGATVHGGETEVCFDESLPSADTVESAGADDNICTAGMVEGAGADDAVRGADDGKKAKKKHKKHRHALGGKRFWVTGRTFALSSFLCFMLAAAALIPVFSCLQTSSATTGKLPNEPKLYFDIFTFIANHLPGVETTIRSSGNNVIPNVYCGLFTVMLLPFYFFSSKISGKKKVVSAILLMAFFCGFVLNFFNFIWHGMHMPNDLPYRYSFAYSFILLTLAYKAFENIGEFSNKAYIGAGFAVICFAVLAERFEIPNCKDITILLSVLFAILYVVIFGMLKSPSYRRNAVMGVLLFTIIIEIVVSDAPKLVMAQSKKDYVADYQNYQDIREKTEKDETEPFYRTELSKLRTRMDPCWYGYNGVSTFSSMAYEHVAKLIKKTGLFGNNINSYTYYPQTPVFNSMFALKYIYDTDKLINSEKLYDKLDSNENFDAYSYKYFLPVAFSTDAAVADWDTSSANPFTVQNEFVKSAAGVEDVLVPVDASSCESENTDEVNLADVNSGETFYVKKTDKDGEGKVTVKIAVGQEGEYYVYAGSTHLSSLNIEAENFNYNYVSSAIEPFVMDVGFQPADSEITVTYSVAKEYDSATIAFCAVRLDMEKFEQAYEKLRGNGTIALEKFDDTSFNGTIDVKNDNAVIFTSVPYDSGWSISADGRELVYSKKDTDGNNIEDSGDILKIGGGLTGFKLGRGKHEISFKYRAGGLAGGIKLTVAGALIVLLLIIVKKFLIPVLIRKNIALPLIFRKIEGFKD